METKFTKGEWSIKESWGNLCTDIVCDDKRICEVKHYDSFDNDPEYKEGLANAKLIAAAPKLLKCLNKIINLSEDGYKYHVNNSYHEEFLKEDILILREAKEVIRKAIE